MSLCNCLKSVFAHRRKAACKIAVFLWQNAFRKKEKRKSCRSIEKDVVEKLNWMREGLGGVFFGSIARNCGSDSRD